MKTKHKIAIFLPSLQVGGAERLIFEELSFMRDDDRFHFEIHLLFEKGPLYEKFMDLGLSIRTWNARHDSLFILKACYEFSRYLRFFETDILHCHLLYIWGPFVGMMAGVRTITTVHNDIYFNLLNKFFMNRNDLILGCGRQVLNNIAKFVPPHKTGLLANGISIKKIQPEKAQVFQKHAIKDGSPLILTLGRLTKQKGYDILIKAFQSVVMAFPQAVLIICGVGDERSLLEGLIKDFKMEEHIKLIGWIDDVDQLLSVCDIYVNSSRYEGLPISLLEAMAHGKAIVATNVAGNMEVVINGKTGILIPPENPQAIAASISDLIENRPLREKLGMGAQQLFEMEYTISKHCEALTSYYSGLI